MRPIHSRMARAALGWSAHDLARQADVGFNTVSRFEGGQDSRMSSVEKMRAALEAAGVMIIEADAAGGPGVRLKEDKA